MNGFILFLYKYFIVVMTSRFFDSLKSEAPLSIFQGFTDNIRHFPFLISFVPQLVL